MLASGVVIEPLRGRGRALRFAPPPPSLGAAELFTEFAFSGVDRAAFRLDERLGAVAVLELFTRAARARRVAGDLAPGARVFAVEPFRRQWRDFATRHHFVFAGVRVLVDLVGLRRQARLRN